jgi:hypothetical protein
MNAADGERWKPRDWRPDDIARSTQSLVAWRGDTTKELSTCAYIGYPNMVVLLVIGVSRRTLTVACFEGRNQGVWTIDKWYGGHVRPLDAETPWNKQP